MPQIPEEGAQDYYITTAFNFLSYYTRPLLPESSSNVLQMVRISETKTIILQVQLRFFQGVGYSVYMDTHREAGSFSAQTILCFRRHSLWAVIRETNCI